MNRKIFVNLPVRDMNRSQAFFRALGLEFNPQFTNDLGACMVISDDIFVMLLVEPYFQSFTKKPVSDGHASTEVLIALSCESRDEVDAWVAKAVAAGATTPNPRQDHGYMLQHGFADLDGHQWEVFWMDMEKAPAQA